MYQRQLSKEGLQSVVNSAAAGAAGASSNAMSTEELRDLFTLRRHTRSDTYDCMCGEEEEEEEECLASTSPMSCEGDAHQRDVHKAQAGGLPAVNTPADACPAV